MGFLRNLPALMLARLQPRTTRLGNGRAHFHNLPSSARLALFVLACCPRTYSLCLPMRWRHGQARAPPVPPGLETMLGAVVGATFWMGWLQGSESFCHVCSTCLYRTTWSSPATLSLLRGSSCASRRHASSAACAHVWRTCTAATGKSIPLELSPLLRPCRPWWIPATRGSSTTKVHINASTDL